MTPLVSSPTEFQPARDEAVLGLTLEYLNRYSAPVCLANIGFSLMTAWVTWEETDHRFSVGWVVAILVTSATRCASNTLWKRSPFRYPAPVWLRIHTIFSAISGILWGVGSWVLLEEQSLLARAFFAFILAGMVSGSATTSAVHRPTFLCFALPSGVLLAARLLSFPDGLSHLMSCVAVFSVALYLRLGLINHRLFRDGCDLRFSNSQLVAQLEEAHLALERTNASLEQRVAERTNSLECEIQARYEVERQLRRSHRMEAVGRLTGGIAHDFNNILTVILNCLDLVSYREQEDQNMIEHARQAASRGADLTQQLLAFSRKSSNLPQVLEINQVLLQLIESMLRPVLRASVELQFEPSPEQVHVQVLRAELESALLNLVLNARDSMPQGGTVRLAIQAHGQEVTVEVQDQGTGIAPQDLERVFEPCYSTKGEDGTGLGLSMVRGFALRSSGDIRAESSSKGTTFYLTLPTCLPPKHAIVDRPRSKLAKAPHSASVLVVEDNPDLLHSTVRVVQDLGYRVSKAKSADEAIVQLREQPVDILLSDIRMPGTMSGLDLARSVAKTWPQVQILLVTGHAPELAGSLDFRVLRKPYSMRQLAQALHEAASEPWPALEPAPLEFG